MLPDDVEDLDPGLARERTKLAWARTAIAFAAVGGTMLRREPVAGLIVLAMTPLIWALGRIVTRGPVRPGLVAQRLLLVTVTVVGVALLALVIAFLGRSPGGLSQILPRHGK